jgi:hypothetical protein
MQERTCPTCGNTFTPATANQTYCPPTDAQRHSAGNRQARSRCAKRASNHVQRTRDGIATIPLDAPIIEAFNCAQCSKACVVGEDGVSAHASKFCGASCKIAWHVAQTQAKALSQRSRLAVIGPRNEAAIWAWREYCALATLNQYFGPVTTRDKWAYNRTLRKDPCAYCGNACQALDHIDPRLHGGQDDWVNRTAACRTCNSLKGSLTLLEALPWIPVATTYHEMRRRLYAA